jgi:phosphate/sulfate permease
VLVLLSIALAFGLVALGIWDWAAFLIVAGAYVLFAVLALGIAYLKLRRISGLSKTRKSVTEGLGMMRPDGQQADGQRPEITAPKTR